MAGSDNQKLTTQVRRWVEQERAWDDVLYSTAPAMGRAGAPAKTARMEKTTSLESQSPVRPIAGAPVRFSADATKKAAALKALYEKYNTCVRCPLGHSRLKFVFGVGNPDAQVLLIGEGPGYQEDHQGEPFVGRSGQLLDKMMEAIGFSRKTIYIANIVKCHPMVNPKTPEEHGNDRPPTPEEVAACSPILQQQIAIIQPRIILTLGSPSTKAILGTQEGISKIRGRLFPMPMSFFKMREETVDLFGAKDSKGEFLGLTTEERAPLETIQVLPTYHPAALLRNPNLKKDAWEDMKLLRDSLKGKTA